MAKKGKPSVQRTNVKNPKHPAFQKDLDNRTKQITTIPFDETGIYFAGMEP